MNQEELKQRLIELLEEAIRHADTNYQGREEDGKYCGLMADHLIANGVTIRDKGSWKVCSDDFGICDTIFVCSCCSEEFVSTLMTDDEFLEMMKYCPHCGADMRGVKDE